MMDMEKMERMLGDERYQEVVCVVVNQNRKREENKERKKPRRMAIAARNYGGHPDL